MPQLTKLESKTNGEKCDLKVFISTHDSTCDECDEELGRHAWITLDQEAPQRRQWR